MQPTPQQTAQFFEGVHPIYRTANKQQEESTMTTNYIPGPWKVAQYDYDSGTARIETVERGTDVPEFGYHVATVSAVDEQDPTARLIAAAPELLESLREILALAEEGVIQRNETGKPQWNLTTALTEISRAAILKATGK